MRRDRRALPIVAAALLLLPGCILFHEHERVVIPDGAQVVHVSNDGAEVTLEPDTVEAGDVYFVNEGPATGYGLVSSMPAPDAEPSGFTEEGLQRLAAGDFQGTLLESWEVSCERAWSESEHWRDCGENAMWTLTEGFYLVMEPGEETNANPRFVVLEVTP